MELGFFLKKLLGQLFMPLPVCLLLLLLGLLLLRHGHKRFATLLSAVSIVFLTLLSTGPVANGITKALEYNFPKYAQQKVDYVLVLGGAHNSDKARPLSSSLSSVSLARLTEGLMVYRNNPGAKLLLSGYAGLDPYSHAEVSSRLAQALGVPVSDIVLAEEVKDTAEEARHWVEYISGKRFALVTSASHMPRAVYLFERQIQHVSGDMAMLVPAPANFTSSSEDSASLLSWIPRARHLEKVEVAWHEYLGILWASLQ